MGFWLKSHRSHMSLVQHFQKHMVSICSIPGDVNLIWLRWCLVCYQVTLFPFVTHKYLVKSTLRLRKYSLLHQTFTPQFQQFFTVLSRISYQYDFCQVVVFEFHHLSTFSSWHSTYKKEFSLLLHLYIQLCQCGTMDSYSVGCQWLASFILVLILFPIWSVGDPSS